MKNMGVWFGCINGLIKGVTYKVKTCMIFRIFGVVQYIILDLDWKSYYGGAELKKRKLQVLHSKFLGTIFIH